MGDARSHEAVSFRVRNRELEFSGEEKEDPKNFLAQLDECREGSQMTDLESLNAVLSIFTDVPELVPNST